MNQPDPTAGFYGERTSWRTIIQVKDGDVATRQAALERLTRRYRLPILRCVQASLPVEHRDQAEDLTQDFIAKRLLAESFFAKPKPRARSVPRLGEGVHCELPQ